MNQSQTKILALDDDSKFLAELKTALSDQFAVRTVTEISDAMKVISQQRPDVLLLDMNMPEVNGMQFLKVVKQRVPELPVLMLTGDSRPEMIVEAIKAGASDYIIKGSEDFITALKLRIAQAMSLSGMKKENEVLSSKLRDEQSRYEILGISSSTIRLKSDIIKVMGTEAYVLILGENGTGKELVARNLNFQEGVATRPFYAVNCGAIPHNLFESELFGHVKGAFSGATSDQVGKFLAANGGDLLLDEIGEMPLDLQVKLLRVLQEKVITPVGSTKTIKINVRVIAATNRKLEDLVSSGKFREDLYYRLNQLTLTTTPLRERPEEILYLARKFSEKRMPGAIFSKEAMQLLENHSWPGNIRELQNTIERACILARGTGSKILPEHLVIANLKSKSNQMLLPGLLPMESSEVTKDKYQECMDWMQRTFIEMGLKLLRGNNNELIERLGISRSHYYERKKELKIGASEDARWM